MRRLCEKCGEWYEDATCWTFCPHSPFISNDDAKRKDQAFALTQKDLQFREPLRIESIDGRGYITLREIEGTFDPSQLEEVKKG